MFCTKCGNEHPDDAAFCNSCGTKIGAQNSSHELQYGSSRVFSPSSSITLNSMPPSMVNPASIVMFRVESTKIIMKIDGEYGSKTFSYIDPQVMYDDCNKLFVALSQITKNMVMQFKSEGGPVVPLFRIKRSHPSDSWGQTRIEVDFENGDREWFQYSNKNVRNADYTTLMNLQSARINNYQY